MKDEYFTPSYAVTPLITYVSQLNPKLIWLPFDTEDSKYYQVLTNAGFACIATHIKDGKDFFQTEPPEDTELIISNPPYSKLALVYERLSELRIPFALLVPNAQLHKRTCELMVGDKLGSMGQTILFPRVHFYKADERKKWSPPWQTCYFSGFGFMSGYRIVKVDNSDFDAKSC